MKKPFHLKLDDGARVAVLGGGPAGSFFGYFLLVMAERLGIHLSVDIYEPRDFSIPGPTGCNMCAGVVSESLVQALAVEGINLPGTVVQRGIDTYALHMDVGSMQIQSLRHEKRIGTTFRGAGPRDLKQAKWSSLDGYLLTQAMEKGARHIPARVEAVEWEARASDEPRSRLVRVKPQKGAPQTYHLLAVTAGVNTTVLKRLEGLQFGYQPPRTTKCAVREYYLGAEAVSRYLGDSMHCFLLNMPGIEFGAIVPKGDYVTVSLLGEEIDANLVQAFLNDPAVKRCLPPNFAPDSPACWCAPRINVGGSAQPFGDRVVFIGDCAVTRLYKDGIGAAYRAAKAAASTAVFQGIAADDFRRHYLPFCRTMERDNLIGKLIFAIVRTIQRMRFARRAVWRMVSAEQEGRAMVDWSMSMVLWDMFTGSAPYHNIFLRTLHPGFWGRFLWEVAGALVVSVRQWGAEVAGRFFHRVKPPARSF